MIETDQSVAELLRNVSGRIWKWILDNTHKDKKETGSNVCLFLQNHAEIKIYGACEQREKINKTGNKKNYVY